MNTLDHLTAAARSAVIYGDSDIPRYFALCMDAAARLKFDGHLVSHKHPLAYEAGTCESRFVAYVKRMADLERERRAARRSLGRRLG